MKPPMCKLCQSAHWLDEEHKMTGALESVRELGAGVLRNTVTVTKSSDENVTEVSTSDAWLAPDELTNTTYTHGGARGGAGRKKEHKTNAERQRVYRERASS